MSSSIEIAVCDGHGVSTVSAHSRRGPVHSTAIDFGIFRHTRCDPKVFGFGGRGIKIGRSIIKNIIVVRSNI